MEGMFARDMCKYGLMFLGCKRGIYESLSDHQVKLLTKFLYCYPPAQREETIYSWNEEVSNMKENVLK